MSSPNSAPSSEERPKTVDAPKASMPKPDSPSGTTPNEADDDSQDDVGEDLEKTTDKAGGSVSVDTPTDNHVTSSQGDWQAIWAPAQNAYYFYNSRTNETTWANPLYPQQAGSTEETTSRASYSMVSTSSSMYAAQAAAESAGIDPSLAYLDPSLVSPGNTPAGSFTARFNARTGAFTRMDARDPSHLSESERAKRMSQVYFDVGAWESEVEARKAREAEEEADGGGKKRKRPTKKDLERFREQKRQKKIAKTAWLRT